MTKREWEQMSPEAQKRCMRKVWADIAIEAVIIGAILTGMLLLPSIIAQIVR